MPSEQWKLFNCYEVLGASPTATPQEIRTSYKQASLRHHPDRGGSHDAQVKVNLAYEVLSNPIERQAHDIHWRISTTGDFARPQTSKPYDSGQAYTRTRETPSGPKQTQREAPRREPLAGLRNRIHQQVEREKARIWQDLNNRAQRNEANFKQQLSNQRQEAAFIFVGLIALGAITVVTQYAWLWIGVAYLGWLLLSRLTGVQIANRRFSIFDFNSADSLRQHAQYAAKESCSKDVNSLERHFSSLASITELLLRPSTFDDSEEQVARRLTASFFLMGYIPIQFDRDDRTLVFTDGDEKILVRFRHRSGIATNITYVEKLVSLMHVHSTTRSFLFCSPGLSGNAANYANTHRVKWYTLETMNHWIEQVLVSDYSGPAGDVLMNLDKLRSFLGTLSPAIATRSYKPRFRYGRYRF
jgi:curved DNA-binding protein CbpA